jgi:nitroreductase
METWDTIRARRNVRQYTDRSIAGENLERVLEAGRRAPSASNWQPWSFVVVTDHAQLTELAKVWRGAGHIARSAAAVALVAREPEDARHRGLLMWPRPTSASAPVTRVWRTRSRRGVCWGFLTATSACT